MPIRLLLRHKGSRKKNETMLVKKSAGSTGSLGLLDAPCRVIVIQLKGTLE
jgi:hypothetical protein